MGQNRAHNQVFWHFFRVGLLVFLEIAQDDSFDYCLTLVEVKALKKISEVPNWIRNQGFCCFLKVASLVFLDIAQDCSSGQCLTSSRAETSKKCFVVQIWAKMIFFYSTVVFLFFFLCNLQKFTYFIPSLIQNNMLSTKIRKSKKESYKLSESLNHISSVNMAGDQETRWF